MCAPLTPPQRSWSISKIARGLLFGHNLWDQVKTTETLKTRCITCETVSVATWTASAGSGMPNTGTYSTSCVRELLFEKEVTAHPTTSSSATPPAATAAGLTAPSCFRACHVELGKQLIVWGRCIRAAGSGKLHSCWMTKQDFSPACHVLECMELTAAWWPMQWRSNETQHSIWHFNKTNTCTSLHVKMPPEMQQIVHHVHA
jgi:hypothetical protein